MTVAPFLVAAGLVVVAVVVALVIRRRTAPPPPVQGRTWAVPAQLHRADFARPEAHWLVVLFSSETCESCAGTWTKVLPLESPDLAVEQVTFQRRRDVHDRYGIEAVPTLLVADDEGVVRASFLGPVTAAELWAALDDLRS